MCWQPHLICVVVKNVENQQRSFLMLHNCAFIVISHAFKCPVCPLRNCCCWKKTLFSPIPNMFRLGIRVYRPLSLIIKFMFAATGKQKHTFKSLYGAAKSFFPVFICVDLRPSLISIGSPSNAAFDKSLPLMPLLSDASRDPNQRAPMGPGQVCPAHSWQTDNSLFALLRPMSVFFFVVVGKSFQARVSSAPATSSCRLRVSSKS